MRINGVGPLEVEDFAEIVKRVHSGGLGGGKQNERPQKLSGYS